MSTCIKPWQVWWLDLNPTIGHEQAGRRPAIVVSSHFHLGLTRNALVSILPLTTRERPEWGHRIRIDIPGQCIGWAITEQVRTVSFGRFSRGTPIGCLNDDQIVKVRTVLAMMLDI
ncbi:MAG: type II toxin-antitoxin system PemK/MazF family toxin [Candidatus Dormibacteraceae bacterium]